MDIDGEKLEQTVLALLHLTSYKGHHRLRAWKGHDWQVMNLLYEKGYISDPATKAKSVELTEEGAKLCKEIALIFRWWRLGNQTSKGWYKLFR